MSFTMAADPDNPRPAAIEREIRTDGGDSETLLVTSIGENLFRAEESSFVTDAVYGDVIEATEGPDGALQFVGIVERSRLVASSWILRSELIETEAFQAVLKAVMDHGGNWERVFGGVLILHTPPAVTGEFQDRVHRLATASPHSARTSTG